MERFLQSIFMNLFPPGIRCANIFFNLPFYRIRLRRLYYVLYLYWRTIAFDLHMIHQIQFANKYGSFLFSLFFSFIFFITDPFCAKSVFSMLLRDGRIRHG